MPDMATKKPVNRPARDVNVIFRCSEEERATFHDAAAAVGLPLSQWLRMIALKEARKSRRE
jgi:hypothetical protein